MDGDTRETPSGARGLGVPIKIEVKHSLTITEVDNGFDLNMSVSDGFINRLNRIAVTKEDVLEEVKQYLEKDLNG